MLIAIEGPDGVGKTTLAKNLAMLLGALYLKFPDRTTESGRVIDQVLRFKDSNMPPLAFQALQTCNRIEKRVWLEMAAKSTTTHAVCDRYVQSFEVYGAQDGLDPAWLRSMAEILSPADINILLSASPAEIMKRLEGREGFDMYEARGSEGLADQVRRYHDLWHFGAKVPGTVWAIVNPVDDPAKLLTTVEAEVRRYLTRVL